MSLPRPVAVALLTFLAAAFCTGCTIYRKPAIEVAELRLTDVSADAAVLTFDLELENSNESELELLEIDYSFSVDGSRVFSGRRSAEATLSRNGRKRIVVPAVIPYASLGWTDQSFPREISYEVSGRVGYVTPGQIAEILLDTGVRKPKASFSRSGTARLEP